MTSSSGRPISRATDPQAARNAIGEKGDINHRVIDIQLPCSGEARRTLDGSNRVGESTILGERWNSRSDIFLVWINSTQVTYHIKEDGVGLKGAGTAARANSRRESGSGNEHCRGQGMEGGENNRRR